MKKFSLLKLISLIFICAMLMSAVAITAFAEGEQETTPTVKIVSKNIYFGDDIQLMFAVDAPEGAHVSATVDGESIGIERFEVQGMRYPVWKTTSGWAAQNINTVVTVTVEYDGVKDVLTYSVLEYLHERIAKLNSEGNLDVEVSEGAGYTKRDQLDMYNALLDYAKAADKVVNAGHTNDLDNYFEVKVVDGTIDGYKSWGVYKLGSYPFADIATTLDYNPNTHVVVWSYTWSGGTETDLTTDEIKDVEVTGDLVITADLKEYVCDHQYTVIDQVNATCTEDGHITRKCSVCDHEYEEILTATGHNYEAQRTEPTCDEDGKIVYTCACGDSYEETLTATGHNYESERTEPTCKEDGKIVYTCTNDGCGDSYAETLKATGHSTANGTCEYCGMIIATVNEWQLVTDAADLEVGDEIFIAAKDKNVAMSTEQKTNNRGQITYTIDGATVTTGVQRITLEAGTKTGTFAFNVGNGYLYAASSGSNHLKTEEKLSANSSWTIEITSEGVATVKAQGTYTRNWMRYNSKDSLFSCYGSGQQDIVIYKLVESYTETCAHDGLVLEVKNPAKCTEDGLKSGHCDICGKDVTEVIPATGHKYTTNETPATCDKDGKIVYTCINDGCGHFYEEIIKATGDHFDSEDDDDTLCDSCLKDMEDDQMKADNKLADITLPGFTTNVTAATTIPLPTTADGATVTWAIDNGTTNKKYSLNGNVLTVDLDTTETVIKLTATITVKVNEATASRTDNFEIKVAKKVATWTKLSSASNLKVGDTIVIVCEGKKMELTSVGSSYGNGTSYSSTPAGTYQLTVVAGSTTGTFAFKTSDGKYLNWSSGNSLTLVSSVTANSSWMINSSLKICNAKDNTRILQWNASSPRFACYTSSQTAVVIYVLG